MISEGIFILMSTMNTFIMGRGWLIFNQEFTGDSENKQQTTYKASWDLPFYSEEFVL